MSPPAVPGFDLNQLAPLMVETLPAAVTVFDAQGIMLYFNERAGEILDRKPEYLGRDIQVCHQKAETREMFQDILDQFQAGRTEPYNFRVTRGEKDLFARVAPLRDGDRLVACIQVAVLLEA